MRPRWLKGVRKKILEYIDKVGAQEPQKGNDVGGYNSFWMDPGKSVIRVNGEPRGSIIVEPADGQIPYQPETAERVKAVRVPMYLRHNPEEQALGVRCMVGFGSSGGPPMLPVLYNNNYRFIQTPDEVLILVEMNHNVRTIRLGGEHLPAAIRPWLGDSIGRWEGDTLVVETSQFHPQQNFRAATKHQLYMSADTKVTERFTRVGENEILYQFTIEDDSIYTQAWRGEMPMRATEGPIYEYACHEGNYSMPGILAGARKEEQDKQQAQNQGE